MSLSKKFAEEQQRTSNLVDALEALVENDCLEDEALGITKKVISDRGLEKLSEKQLHVYNTVVQPLLVRRCDTEDCQALIGEEELAEAITNDALGQGSYCHACAHMHYQMAKDD